MNKIFVAFLSAVLLFADDFIIGAYGVDTAQFSNVHDSLGLNTVLHGSSSNYTAVLNALSKAETESLKVILSKAVPQSPPWRRLTWYADLWHKLWESEENEIYFSHEVGKAVLDTSASQNSAWVCSVNVHQPGVMQTGQRHWQLRIPTNGDFLNDSVRYTARFWLKIDTFDVSSNTPVCSLVVCGPEYEPDSIFKDSVLRIRDFPAKNQYCPFDLQFRKKPGSNDLIWYVIHWYGNVNLWADYVEVKDCYVDSLEKGDYDSTLHEIARLYSPIYCPYKSLFRFYLRDEPYYGHFPANAYVMEFLNREETYQKGIQALGGAGKTFFQAYVDSVKPNELMFDYYPFRGGRDRTPEDSGLVFQNRLDELCTQLSDMRIVALEDSLDFWNIPQAFGKYDAESAITPDSGGDEGAWRLPTSRELRCATWLSLAYGAKGIMYFRFTTYLTYEAGFPEWIRGLWRYDNNPREPLYSEARNLNLMLKKIGNQLLSLESDTVFKASDGIPQDCFIKSVKIWDMLDTLIQIGTFHKTSNPDENFFIIVNRHCLPSETLEVIVGLEDTLCYLYDCYSTETITYEEIIGWPQPPYYYRIKLQPGQGRLFRMVPFTQEFKINQNQTYTNLPFVALRTKATSSLGVDSMKIWQYYVPHQETLRYCYSTGWIPYDTAYCWYLLQGEGNNIVYIQYKVGGFSESPVYCDTIIFDKTVPSGSFVINDNNKFTNNPNVTIKNSMSDAGSSMSKMRYGNKYLKNLIKNSAFNGLSFWQTDTAIYHDSLKLFEIPVQTVGNYFYQSIPPESLAGFVDDTLLLWIDLVSDDFVGTCKVQFQYIYGVPGDTNTPRGQYPYGTSITIPEGTYSKVAHYNLYSYFRYHPEPPPGKVLLTARVGVFIDANVQNSGRLVIDNFKLDVVSPSPHYTKFENYDSYG